jgi:hypothetical protein
VAFDVARAIFVARMQLWNPTAQAETSIYVASRAGFTISGVAVTAAPDWYIALEQPTVSKRSAFAPRRIAGRSTVAIGEVIINNRHGLLDHLRFFGWDGRAITISYLMAGEDYATAAVPFLDATMERATFGQDTISVALRDWSRALDRPLQAKRYAGDNVPPDGLEGGTELAGRPKPITLGAPRLVEPVLVNAQKLIYQVHDDVLADIAAVYDQGVDLLYAQWTARTSTVSDEILGLTVGNGLVVAVGDNGSLATSADGASWTSRSSGTASALTAVAYGDGLYVGVGVNGVYVSSSNGTTWSAGSTGFLASALAITFGANLFIAPTLSGGVLWYDGTWHVVGGVHTSALLAATYGNGVFLVAGNDCFIYSSSTGTSGWTNRFSDAGSGYAIYGLAYGNGVYLAVGDHGRVLRSTNGTTWSLLFDGTSVFGTERLTAIAYGHGRWTAVSAAGSVGLSLDDGETWVLHTSTFSGASINAVTFVASNARFVIAGAGGQLATSDAMTLYGSEAALLDDGQAPAAGTVGAYLAGGYIRLGSPAVGRVTCSPVQGASASNRTAGQLFVQVLERAGFTTGDWSASDITTLDSANNAELGFYATNGDSQTCAEALDEIAGSVGAAWFTDASGVIRIRRLMEPDSNVVSNPFTLASAPWNGVGTYTDNYATIGGVSFTRVQGNGSTNYRRQAITLTGDGVKCMGIRVKHNGATGRDAYLLFDGTSGTSICAIEATFMVDGTIRFALAIGSNLRVVRLPGGEYDVRADSTPATASHTFEVYASGVGASLGTGGVTDSLVSAVRVYDAPADAVFSQADMDGMEQLPSEEEDGGLATNQLVLRYARNYAPMTSRDFAGAVGAAARERFAAEWFTIATAPDNDVVLAHPFARPRTEESLITHRADAELEAARRQTLYGVDHDWFDVPLFLSATALEVDLFDVVELSSTRYGIGAGHRALVLGIDPDITTGRVVLSCWLPRRVAA